MLFWQSLCLYCIYWTDRIFKNSSQTSHLMAGFIYRPTLVQQLEQLACRQIIRYTKSIASFIVLISLIVFYTFLACSLLYEDILFNSFLHNVSFYPNHLLQGQKDISTFRWNKNSLYSMGLFNEFNQKALTALKFLYWIKQLVW